MAHTQTVARCASVSVWALAICIFVSVVAGLEVGPSDDFSDGPYEDMEMLLLAGSPSITIKLEPLTPAAGLDQSSVALNAIIISGQVKQSTLLSQAATQKGDIALVSCDSYAQGSSTASRLVEDVSAKKPSAVILYSLDSRGCSITGVDDNKSYYTTVDLSEGDLKRVTASTETAQIASDEVTFRGMSTPSAVPTPIVTTEGNQSSQPAVAMSILYAVTGIITGLFVAIIVTGAWRARTNPERYGPRTAFNGRPRQSRAKGLARAILETFPIIKFGDEISNKGGNHDVELHGVATRDSRPSQSETRTDAQSREDAAAMATGPMLTETTSAHQESSPKPEHNVSVAKNSVCSICTDDFTKGEEVRVLPCEHLYHPACIDPWLVNVSATCPLCRVDLNPSGGDMETPSTLSNIPNRMSRAQGVDENNAQLHRIRELRNAPVHVRLDMLRQLAREAEHERHQAGTAEDEAHRHRLADRLRRAFHIRTRRAGVSDAGQLSPEVAASSNTAVVAEAGQQSPEAGTSSDAPATPLAGHQSPETDASPNPAVESSEGSRN